MRTVDRCSAADVVRLEHYHGLRRLDDLRGHLLLGYLLLGR
jgi:hypothetical protein